MKERKGLFVLNIIILAIMIILLIVNVIIFTSILDIKAQLADNPEAGESLGGGIGLALLLVFQVILAIPYGVIAIICIVTLCKKYFNWLSFTNAGLCLAGVVLTVLSFLNV